MNSYSKVKLGKFSYLISLQDPGVILKENYEEFSQKEIKKDTGFELGEFYKILCKILDFKNTNKNLTLDKTYMINILQENFLNQGFKLSEPECLLLLKGINYAILKSSDVTGICKVLEKIRMNNLHLSYRKLQIQKLLTRVDFGNLGVYLREPFGSIDDCIVKTIPLMVPIISKFLLIKEDSL